MPIIDINVRFGAYPVRHKTSTAEQVTADAERLGVDISCVCSTTGIYYIDREGNRQTLAAVEAQPQRLCAVATLNPAATIDAKAAVDGIASSGQFKLVRFFPDVQGWPIDFAPFTSILKLLSDAHLPAMVACTRLGDATQLARIISDGNGHTAPVVLEGVCATNLAEILEAMRNCPSLSIEMHAVVFADGLRRIRDAVGVDRIVFGSGASALSLGAALSYISGSDLSTDEKNKLLGGNAAKLLGI